MTDKFHHHPLLQVVANEDVRFLLDKDRKYGASWKKSGGRSAWFMMVRKMDRLMEMMEPEPWPESFSIADLKEMIADNTSALKIPMEIGPSEASFTLSLALAHDMFAKIEDAPGGEDGTVLAEIRDLRRYLLLVEAEMTARGVVARPSAETLPPLTERVLDKLDLIMTHVSVLVEGLSDMRSLRHSRERRAIESLRDLLFYPETKTAPAERPDETVSPWIVHPVMLSNLSKRAAHLLYRRMAPESAVLETYLTEPEHYELLMMDGTTIVQDALRCYEKIGNFWVLRVAHAPAAHRSAWPTLTKECNGKEHADLEPWRKALYFWQEAETKFRIHPEHRAWTEDGQ